MKFSYFLPNMLEGRFAKMGSVAWQPMLERARTAEDLGYDGLWLGEYIETQKDVATGFPGEPPHNYAPLTTMTALAMSSQKLRVTTGVIVLPYYDPLILGREMAHPRQHHQRSDYARHRARRRSRRLPAHAPAARQGQPLAHDGGVHRSDARPVDGANGVVPRRLLLVRRPADVSQARAEPLPDLHGRQGGRGVSANRKSTRREWIEVGFNPENMKSRAELIRRYMEEEGRGEEHLEVARQFLHEHRGDREGSRGEQEQRNCLQGEVRCTKRDCKGVVRRRIRNE